MTDINASSEQITLAARDYVDPTGDVVQSGTALAEAVLASLNAHRSISVDLHGIMGASTSYFNAFLARVSQRYEMDDFDERVSLDFASSVQEMVYTRSRDSLRQGMRPPTADDASQNEDDELRAPTGILGRILSYFRKSL